MAQNFLRSTADDLLNMKQSSNFMFDETGQKFHISGDYEVTIPEYMVKLLDLEIEQICCNSNRNNMVIAAGVDPDDMSLVILTGSPEVRNISATSRLTPKTAKPVLGGRGIEITFEEVEGVYLMDAALVVERSLSSLKNSKLFLNDNYMCDIESQGTDAEDDLGGPQADHL